MDGGRGDEEHLAYPGVADEEVGDDGDDAGQGLEDAVVEHGGGVFPTVHDSRHRGGHPGARYSEEGMRDLHF